MKVEITSTGELVITPEDGLETYALMKWHEDWLDKKSVLRLESNDDHCMEVQQS